MTSKLVVNTIESDTGISSVSFASSISMSSTSKFFFSDAGIDIGADTNINRPSAGKLAFNINSSEKVRITSDGFLGISTASVLAPFHAFNATNNTIARLESGDATCRLQLVDSAGMGFVAVSGDNLILANTSSITERLRIDSSGRIGVGVVPTAQYAHNLIQIGHQATLGANAALSSTGQTFLTHNLYFDTGGTLKVFNTSNANEGAIFRLVDGQLLFSNSAATTGTPTVTERFRITSDGKFGFGTSSPDQTVHIHKGSAGSVSSTANTVLTLENSTTNVLQFLNPNNTAAQVRFGDPQDDGIGFIEYSHNANTMSFGVYGPTRMQLDSNGHLGIAVASGTQLANSKMLTLRPTDDDGIRFVRPGDGNNVPNVHLDVTTTTSGSSLRSGGEAYTTKYHTYNCDMLFRSYLGGGTGGIIRFVTSDTDSGTQRFWQIDEDGMTTHRSISSTVKTHEFSYTGGAGNSTLNVNLLSISGYSASSTAVVKIEYVGMYGLANSYISQGIWLCSYRRALGGSAANALAQQTHNSGSNSSSNVTMAWVGDNLRLTVGAFTGFTVHVTATVYNATINVLV